MKHTAMNRREFLRTTSVAAAALTLPMVNSAEKRKGVAWPIGCFNRPWVKWSYDDALDGIKSAGYKLTGLLTVPKNEAFTLPTATPDYLDGLKKRITTRGLGVNMAALRFKSNETVENMIKDVRAQVDNAARLKLTYLLTFGIDKPENYDKFYKLMADIAPYADERKLRVVMKPHGGGSGASEEILRCI